MTDFEDRLSSALRSAGGEAPDGAGLASAARRRAGVRRRRTALTTAAAFLAVVGVVGGAALLGNRDGGGTATPAVDGPTPTATSTPSVVATSGRVESWRDISVVVPASWGHGSLGDWCASGGELGEPVVERPGASVDILCSPEEGYGVRFGDGALFDAAEPPGEVWQYTGGDVRMYPEGAWLGYQRTDDALAFVSAPTRKEAEQVLGSFTRNSELDANGCKAHSVGSSPIGMLDDLVRLCRYAIDGWLEQSELLAGQDAAAALAALEAAPAKDDRMCTTALTGPTVQVTSFGAEGMVTLDACQGFSWDGAEHDLTADVLYWVLSPGWSGGVEGDVPMPSKFRS